MQRRARTPAASKIARIAAPLPIIAKSDRARRRRRAFSRGSSGGQLVATTLTNAAGRAFARRSYLVDARGVKPPGAEPAAMTLATRQQNLGLRINSRHAHDVGETPPSGGERSLGRVFHPIECFNDAVTQ